MHQLNIPDMIHSEPLQWISTITYNNNLGVAFFLLHGVYEQVKDWKSTVSLNAAGYQHPIRNVFSNIINTDLSQLNCKAQFCCVWSCCSNNILFRKKHPLMFSFISPWKMFKFPQNFQGMLKGMSDERQNRPILSADKIARQKSVVCHAKIARFRRPR